MGLHWSNMSKNQLRTVGPRGFCGAWCRCRWARLRRMQRRGGRGGVGGWSAGDGVFWLPPARPLYADTCGSSWLWKRCFWRARFPQQLPAGASGGSPPLVWCPTQTNGQGNGGPLGPHVTLNDRGFTFARALLLCTSVRAVIDCGDDLLGNNLLLSSSALPVSVSVRSPFVPSASVSRSPCRRLACLLPAVCQHHTKPTHTSHPCTSCFFSLGSRLESSSQQESVSLRKVVLTSSTACRTRPRCCFLHTWALPHFPHALQSDLLPDHLPDLHWCPLHTEIYPAQMHRMCLSVPWLKRTRKQVMSATNIQAWFFMARAPEVNGKACQAEGEGKVVEWKAPCGERTKIARDLFHRPWGQGIQRNH